MLGLFSNRGNRMTKKLVWIVEYEIVPTEKEDG